MIDTFCLICLLNIQTICVLVFYFATKHINNK